VSVPSTHTSKNRYVTRPDIVIFDIGWPFCCVTSGSPSNSLLDVIHAVTFTVVFAAVITNALSGVN